MKTINHFISKIYHICLILSILFATPLWAKTEIFFSPDGNCQQIIINKIDKAEKSIEVAAFDFTNKYILDAIKQANNRGVNVRIILDNRQAKGKYSLSKNILIDRPKWIAKTMSGKKGGVFHLKIICIDNKYAITGSYNFTDSAEYRNRENIVIIDDTDIVARYKAYFNFLWR